ncbi:MAG: hypothetical protein JWO38_1894, partial [Gemmataceae bacterium]|nr:hypothetical protein [Gemmataceae bacterium]
MTKDKTRRAKSIPPVAGDWVANFPEDPAHYAVMIGDVRVRIRRADRVFDGGAVCRAYGTRWADYRASVQGQAAIAATARRFGIPRHRVLTTSSPAQAPAGPFTVPYTAVVETRPAAAAGTGRGGAREIWVHPDLVVGLVTWHDPGAGGLVVFWFEQLWGYRESGAAVWPPVPSSLPHRFGVADLTPRATDELLTAGPFDHADGMDRTHAALARL